MRRFLLFFVFTACCILSLQTAQAQSETWKAGVAKTVITPEESLWMAGYAARNRPAEDILHDIWAKALAVEDASGTRVLLITADLLGMPKKLSDRIRDRLKDAYDLSRAQVLLNSSHTHTGPVLEDALYDIYPLDEAQLKAVSKYSADLEDKIVDLAGEALASLAPAKIYTQNGVARFQVNRRNNDEASLHIQTALNGPNDYAVPVIKVVNEAGEITAIAFGYACHPTVLSSYQWSGDYPGFAQIALEKKYPGATALFFQGAGADQNPLPRRTVPLAQQYGQMLAASVERVLNEDMKELSPQLSTAYAEVDLSLNDPPGKEVLTRMAEEAPSYQKRWAERMLDKMNREETFQTSYPYPLQVWRLGDQAIFSLGGELVVAYAIQLKQIFGTDIFVLGYSNDVMAYIPSAQILREGGYEGASSQMVYGLPGTWTPDIESKIIHEMVQVAQEAGLAKMKSSTSDE